jgi:hypothetical protein
LKNESVGKASVAGSELRRCAMFSRISGQILAVLLLATIFMLRVLFFLMNEKQAVEIDLADIEGW